MGAIDERDLAVRLTNQTRNIEIVQEVQEAKSFWARSRGLLGRSHFDPHCALWISPCNSIHTCLMKFPIDAIFVSKDLKVQAIYLELKPWRLTLPKWKAFSVFEFQAGVIDKSKVNIGDQLYVGP